jgi:predicted CoA-binding protein
MKADEKALEGKKGFTELAEGKESFDLLYLMRKAEHAAPQGEQFDASDPRAHGKLQSWHTFQTP